jgi:tetratricopeptide (TPR) repeat protein
MVKANPKDVMAHERLGRRLLAIGQFKQAQDELRAVLEIAPAHPDANLMMASIAAREGRRDEAANYARAVLRTNPSHVDANLFMAVYLAQSGRPEEAVKHLETALPVNSNRSDVKFQLGLLYAQVGRLPDALRLARELQKSEPKSFAPPLLMGAVFIGQQKPQEAIEAFNSALKLKGDLPEAHRGLGQAYQMLNQPDRAAESYQRALTLNGKDVASLNNLAWLLLEVRKKPDEALPLATKAEQLAPTSPEVLDTLGWVYYRRGAFPEAEKTLLRAVERAPNNGTIRYHLGMTYARLGKKQDAVSALRRAAQLDPKLSDSERIDSAIKELGG